MDLTNTSEGIGNIVRNETHLIAQGYTQGRARRTLFLI